MHPGDRTVEVRPGGLWLHGASTGEGKLLPMWVGSMHYWRHAPEHWGPCLDAMKAMGLRVVDTYVPWGVHEVSQGEFDFGDQFARLDVQRFMQMCHERGLYVIARPGPHINAELTYFGLPERVVWDPECQARSPQGHPVVLPMVPTSFPVPSYASEAFFAQTAAWFQAVGKQLSSFQYPEGPIVLWQIDNEGALYFRDGPYDQDYHPDSIALFRKFIREKALGDDLAGASAEAQDPPTRFQANTADDLGPHLDFMEFHEYLLATAMGRFSSALADAGCGRVPTMHNLPPGEEATALNAGRLGDVIDMVGLDYYHRAAPRQHMTVLRRTTELASRSEGRGATAYGAEVGAGFSPILAPCDETDCLYTLLCALGYGLRGFNLYMAVERDRWVGAPIDAYGLPRPLADRYHALIDALDQVSFHTMTRQAPVRLIVPRALRRLARATHAFGPVTPAFFNVTGSGPTESCFEDDFGLSPGSGLAAPIAGEAFLRAFERALVARGVPFAYAGGDALSDSVGQASWLICTTAGGVKPEVIATLQDAAARGVRVTVGPSVPERDGKMRRLQTPLSVDGLRVEALDEPARADVLVARAIEELALPAYVADPSTVFVTVHEDGPTGRRVVFVMNPEPERVVAHVALGHAHKTLVDLLSKARSPQRVRRESGAFVVEMPPRTVRLFLAEE